MTSINFKNIVKIGVKRTLGIVTRPISQYYLDRTNGLTAFVFHDVTDYPSSFALQYGLYTSADTFQRQVSWISRNFNVIHPFELIEKTSLPPRAALITFDDGFLGSFENGLDILVKYRLPSVMFLNMRAILESRPILSAIACYLDRYVPEFTKFANSIGIRRPFHLTLKPSHLALFENQFGKIDLQAVSYYQGRFVNLEILQKWIKSNVVVYGNHLFDHWNSTSLSLNEFDNEYKMNQNSLFQFDNWINLFAFTNGQPVSCFSDSYIERVNQLGSWKAFSSSGSINNNSVAFLLDRLSFTESDDNEDYLWFRIGQGILKSVLA